MTLNTIK